MVVPAPGLFSTMTGCFHSSVIFSATSLAEPSAEPPGTNPTMILTALFGKDRSAPCAAAGLPASVAVANAARARSIDAHR